MSKTRRTKKKQRATEKDANLPAPEALEDHHEEAEANPGLAEPEADKLEVETDPLRLLEIERDALTGQLLRARADFDNYRKRVARDTQRLRQMAAENLVRDMLPVMDNLDLALKYKDEDTAALTEGVAMVARQLQDVMDRHGLTPIEAAGRAFDPTVHEAVAQIPSEDLPAGQVVQEFQRGYTLGDQVIRPSKVTVSAGPASPVAEEAESLSEESSG